MLITQWGYCSNAIINGRAAISCLEIELLIWNFLF